MRRTLVLCAALSIGVAVASSASRASRTQAAEAQQPNVKEWTFLVFLNGNNDLDRYGSRDINEMEKVGSTDHVNVVVQWASLSHGPTRRLLVKRDNDTTNVTSPILEDIGNADMGDWRSLVEFVRWGVKNYPAKRYFIDVWNHGSGWHFKSLDGQSLGPKDISWDDRTRNFIKTEQLGQALSEAAKIIGHKIDIYGSDACLMGMVEVAGEMAGQVDTFVGAEEVEPLDGWPYDALLSRWVSGKVTDPKGVARILVEEYVKSYQGGSQGTEEVTLSAYDMDKLSDLMTAMRALGTDIKRLSRSDLNKVATASTNAQKFTYYDYGDLLDFLGNIETARVAGLDPVALNRAKAAAGDFVIANSVTDTYAKAKGVAIWLPYSKSSFDSYGQRYRGLRFDAQTGWSEAVSRIVNE